MAALRCQPALPALLRGKVTGDQSLASLYQQKSSHRPRLLTPRTSYCSQWVFQAASGHGHVPLLIRGNTLWAFSFQRQVQSPTCLQLHHQQGPPESCPCCARACLGDRIWLDKHTVGSPIHQGCAYRIKQPAPGTHRTMPCRSCCLSLPQVKAGQPRGMEIPGTASSPGSQGSTSRNPLRD